MNLRVTTEEFTTDRPLLDLLPDLPDDERFAFVQDGQGLVAWGVAARIDVGTGPDRFARAREALTDLAATAAHSSDGLPRVAGAAVPAELIAFASFTFDDTDDGSVMVVPRVIVGRRGSTTWRSTVGSEASTAIVVDDVRPDGARADRPERDRPRYAGSSVRDDRWLDAVATATAEIRSRSYEKVVLARDLRLWSREPFDTRTILEDLAARFPSCMTFLVDHLVGASPEQLLRREGRAVSSRVLAGTAARDDDEEVDQRLGAALLASSKDLHEHALALRSVAQPLDAVCEGLLVPAAPSLLKLDNVQHLSTELKGTLRPVTDGDPSSTHILDLLGTLHPTAAVGGVPTSDALAAIRRLEGMARGRYAGPTGWCSADGDGEFAIALRCAEIHGTRARLFAGAGIVAGSLPEHELTETWLKLSAMTGALDR